MSTQRVLLLGQSLLLALVAASLYKDPAFSVCTAVTWAEVTKLLAEHMPDVLIFDRSATYESHIFPLLLASPGLLLIGLDSEQNRALLVSGQEAQSLTLDQVKEIIQRR